MTIDIHLAFEAVSARLNVTTNATLMSSYGMLGRVIVVSTHTAGIAILDSTTTTSTAANTVINLSAAQCTPGAIFALNWPISTGLTVIPGGGAVNVSWN